MTDNNVGTMPLASPLLFFLFDFLCQTQQTPYAKKRKAFGTAGGTRTPDLLVRSQSLYPAELLPLVCLRVSLTAFVYYHTFPRIASLFFNFFRFFDFSLLSSLNEPKAAWPKPRRPDASGVSYGTRLSSRSHSHSRSCCYCCRTRSRNCCCCSHSRRSCRRCRSRSSR